MDLGSQLRAHIKNRKLSVAAFARKIGVKPPFVFLVERGIRRIPARKIELWADALELHGKEREDFIEAAWLGHAPPYVQELVMRLERRLRDR